MRKLMIAAVVLAVFSISSGENITFEFSLDPEQIEYQEWRGQDVVYIPGGVVPFDHGDPALPGLPYTFLLPQGTSVSRVVLDVHSQEELAGTFSLAPVTAGILSRPFSPAAPSAAYMTPGPFPSQPVSATRSGSRSGYRLGSFVLVPFSWDPLTGSLSVITAATVTVECGTDMDSPAATRTQVQLSTAAEALQHVVDNPEMLDEWSPQLRPATDGDPVWVAIGEAEMESVIQPLVDHRNQFTGQAEYVTLDFIQSNYSGYDTPEKIRNYLKDQHNNHSLIYALIVGDYGETTRISGLVYSGNHLNNVIDHYYIDLDGTWDGDGDHIYGEAGDGISYYSDLYVGRFSSDNAAHLQYMVEKTIDYETDAPDDSWKTTALLIGAGLWPPDYWGSFICQDIADYIPAGWTVEKLYENASSHPNNQVDIINDGCSYVAPQGHGAWSGIYWYDYAPTEIIAVNNYADMTNIDRLPVFHSIACMAGELTEGACIAERLMLSPFGGGVAVMFNSSYGWGTPPARGPSEWLELKFAEQLFGFGVHQIGITQSNAKDAIQALVSVPLIDWVTQENNLLGDPALTFITGQNSIDGGIGQSAPSPVLSAPSPNPARMGSSISYDVPASGDYSVTVYDMSGRAVRMLHSGVLPAGSGSLAFDGTDGSGNPLPSGCYSVLMSGPSGMDAVNLVIAR